MFLHCCYVLVFQKQLVCGGFVGMRQYFLVFTITWMFFFRNVFVCLVVFCLLVFFYFFFVPTPLTLFLLLFLLLIIILKISIFVGSGATIETLAFTPCESDPCILHKERTYTLSVTFTPGTIFQLCASPARVAQW